MVRALPEDGTNGFFVACFVKEDPTNPITVSKATVEAVERAQEKWNKESQETIEAEEGGELEVVDGEEEEQPALPVVSNGGKKGGKKTKAPSSVVRPKDEVLGNLKVAAKTAVPKDEIALKKEGEEESAAGAGAGGGKLTKKQLYLMKKAELQKKKDKAAGKAE